MDESEWGPFKTPLHDLKWSQLHTYDVATTERTIPGPITGTPEGVLLEQAAGGAQESILKLMSISSLGR